MTKHPKKGRLNHRLVEELAFCPTKKSESEKKIFRTAVVCASCVRVRFCSQSLSLRNGIGLLINQRNRKFEKNLAVREKELN